MSNNPGKLRVGKYDWKNNTMPIIDGFENVLVHIKEELSPFVLKDSNGVIMENYWQFSKLWPKVYNIHEPISRYSNRNDDQVKYRWKWPTDVHYKDGKILD